MDRSKKTYVTFIKCYTLYKVQSNVLNSGPARSIVTAIKCLVFWPFKMQWPLTDFWYIMASWLRSSHSSSTVSIFNIQPVILSACRAILVFNAFEMASQEVWDWPIMDVRTVEEQFNDTECLKPYKQWSKSDIPVALTSNAKSNVLDY